MQAAICFVQPPLLASKSAIFVSSPSKTATFFTNSRTSPFKANASRASETSSVNYNSPFSVFPAEACDVVGGNACEADMYPETKPDTPKMMTQPNNPNAMEHFDREYFDYSTDPKSVLRQEACDDLGGEYCEAS